MKGIKRDRCGYSGYSCQGLEPLDDVFRVTKMVCDTEQNRTSGFEATGGNLIDNYLNLPTSVAGFGTLVDVIKDMRMAWSAPCADDSYSDNVRLLGRFIDRVVYKGGGSGYSLFRDALTCFAEGKMYPGLLEPDIPGVAPAPVADIPSVDSGATLLLKYLGGLMAALKDYLPTPLPVIDTCGLPGLIGAMANTSPCKLLKIELVSGVPLVYGDGTETLPTCVYRVTGGEVTINDMDVPVADKLFTAPFTVYANLRRSDNSWYAELSETKEDSNSVYVGSVKEVDTSKSGVSSGIAGEICDDSGEGENSTRTKYKMYAIDQATCIEDVKVPESGLVGLVTELGKTSMCPDFTISWVSGETHVSGDGDMPVCTYSVGGAYVNLNGERVKVDGIDSIEAPFYVYLNVSEDGKSAELSRIKGSNSTAIGGVVLVDSQDSGKPGERQRMYVIQQDDCLSAPVIPWEAPELCGVEDFIANALGADISQDCSALAIQYVSGPLKVSWVPGTETEPDFTEPTVYQIPGGELTVNGKAFPVDSASFTAPFHAYLNPKRNAEGTLIGYGVSQTKETGSVSIGRVSMIRSDAEIKGYDSEGCSMTKASRYKAWKVSQDTCDNDMNLSQVLTYDQIIKLPRIDSIAANAANAATCGILDLMAIQNIASPCPTAKIVHFSGRTICELEEGRDLSWDCDPVYYTVTGFTMRVNGESVVVKSEVDGTDAPVEAPFELYLNMYKNSDGKTTANMTTVPDENADSVKYLGGVQLVSSSDATPEQKVSTDRCETVREEDAETAAPVIHNYAMMKVVMADCPEDYELPDVTDVGALEGLFLAQLPSDICPHVTITKTGGDDVAYWKPAYAIGGHEDLAEPEISANYKVELSGSFSGGGSNIPFEFDNSTLHKDDTVAAPFYIYAVPHYDSKGVLDKYVAVLRKGTEDRPKPLSAKWIYAGKVQLARTREPSAIGGMYKAYKVETVPCLENQLEQTLESTTMNSFYDISESGCPNFHISKTGGRGFWGFGEADDSTYSISSGKVSVNGELISVEGRSGIKAPFNAYVKFSAGSSSISASLQVTAGGGNLGADTVLIGGVSRVDGGKTNSKYSYNKIEVYSCDVATDMIRTDSGFIFKKSSSGSGSSGGSGSGGNPYKAYQPTTCQ